MKNELFDLVLKAQQCDQEAMQKIIRMFRPAIQSAKITVSGDRQNDLEQIIIEKLINKIRTYDISKTPDFTSFKQYLILSSTNQPLDGKQKSCRLTESTKLIQSS